MDNGDSTVILGRIVGVYGVRGMVKIHSECRPREAIFRYRHFLATPARGGEPLSLTLRNGRLQGQGLVAAFAEIGDRDQAQALRDYRLAVRREDLPALAEGEYYWADLIGLQVVNTAGAVLGDVHELFETGANDVMVVKNGKAEILIPFVVGHYILEVDLAARRIVADWETDWLAD
ncbi:MAG: ribosome maturation factor RimM [Cardiobacteriaceae bacterium]|nr:ribosome maturation factor RimM [Cardiobacteriaceae bacterium]